MQLIDIKKIVFWGVNLILAALIVILVGWIVLKGLDRYTGHGEFVVVPDLRGMTPTEASPSVNNLNLQTIVIDSVYAGDNDNYSTPGAIIEQSPSPGSKVKSNRVIQLTINAFMPEMIAFPSLRNKSYRQSLQTLNSVGLKLGRIEYTSSKFKNLVVDFKYNGEIIKPGTMIPKGEHVDMILGDGNTTTAIPIPSLIGKTVSEARAYLLSLHLNLGEVVSDETIESKTDRERAWIYRQNPDPKVQNSINLGKDINVFISLTKNRKEGIDTLDEGDLPIYDE